MHGHLLTNAWFGKAIGAMCAWLWAPNDKLWLALALIAGIACGHLYDLYATRVLPAGRRSAQRAADLARFGRAGKEQGAQDPFMQFMFTAMGHVAKASGNVTPTHIRFTQQIIKQMGLRGDAAERAKQWFRQGKYNRGQLEKLARQCLRAGQAAEQSRITIIQTLCSLTALRANSTALAALRKVGSYLGVAPSVIADEMQQIGAADGASDEPAPAPQGSASDDAMAAAFACLDIEPGSSPAEAKLAYRRLVSRFHPDRLPPDATPAETELAQQRMVELRDALERIQASEASV